MDPDGPWCAFIETKSGRLLVEGEEYHDPGASIVQAVAALIEQMP